MTLDHLLTPHTRTSSQCIKDLNGRPETIKILEENIGSKISDIAYWNFLSDISPQARETKEKDKWGFIKLKKNLHNKGNCQENKKQPTEWESIFTNTSDKGLIFKIYKVFTEFNSKVTNNPLRKRAKDLNRHFSLEEYKWAIAIWKDIQHHKLSQKRKLKSHLNTISHLSEWLLSINQQTTSSGEDVEKGEPFCTVGGNADWWSHCGKQYGDTSKN